MIEQIPIVDRLEWLQLRHHDVTASVAGALLGVHEYATPFSLWALKSGKVLSDAEETPAMIRGRMLEPVAIDLIRDLRPGWTIKLPATYYRDTGARIGATPDAIAIDPDRGGAGVIQIKTVEPSIFRRKWRDESGNVEVPLWIAIQALVEADLTGSSWAAVAAMRVGFGLDMDIIDIPLHKGILDRLRAEVAAFWRSVEEGRPPDPNPRLDASTVEALYAPTSEMIDLSADNRVVELADERERLSHERTSAEKKLKEIKTELLIKLGTASSARIADGRVITANRVNKKSYTVKETSYIDIRVRKGGAV